MSDRRTRMIEDRYLRDSARALVEADIEHLKSNFAHKGFAQRAIDRVRDGATDLYDEAVETAEDNKGALAALLAAIVVWFSRNPIMELMGWETDEERDPSDKGPEH